MTVYSPQFSNFVKFTLKMWKGCNQLKSLSKRPWDSSKETLLIYHFSLSYEGGETCYHSYNFGKVNKQKPEKSGSKLTKNKMANAMQHNDKNRPKIYVEREECGQWVMPFLSCYHTSP